MKDRAAKKGLVGLSHLATDFSSALTHPLLVSSLPPVQRLAFGLYSRTPTLARIALMQHEFVNESFTYLYAAQTVLMAPSII